MKIELKCKVGSICLQLLFVVFSQHAIGSLPNIEILLED